MTDRVFLGHTTAIVAASITRPANTNAYTAGYVVGTAASHIIDFPLVARSAGGNGMISTALLLDSANQTTPPLLELWLFSIPPAVQADNTAFALSDAELANLIGVIPLSTARIGNLSAGAAGSLVIQSDVATLAFACAGGTEDLFGVLVMRNAYTPVSGETFTVKLAALQDY